MSHIFVDYENVHDAGLAGISDLKENDVVVIFYGSAIKNIPFDLHVQIMNSKARTEYIKTAKTAKNYLDFQLSSYLGYCIGCNMQGPFYIISKDTGFDSVVDLWTDKGFSIKRVETVEAITSPVKNQKKEPKPSKASVSKKSSRGMTSKTKTAAKATAKAAPKVETPVPEEYVFPESFRKKVRTAIKSIKIAPNKYSSIYRFMSNCSSVSEFRQHILQTFGEEDGTYIYNHTQIIYGEYRKESSKQD